MSAETLRKAAALMRERAEALEGRRWTWTGAGGDYPQYVTRITSDGNAALVAETFGGPDHPAWEAEHIASWHPAVALAVADWLDDIAAGWPWDDEVADLDGNPLTLAESVDSHAITVARAYLGETE